MQRAVCFDLSGNGIAGCVPQPPDPVGAGELGDGHLSGHMQFSGGGSTRLGPGVCRSCGRSPVRSPVRPPVTSPVRPPVRQL